MKQETKELIEGLKTWFEDFRSNATLTNYTEWAIGDGEGYADEGASNMDKIISLLDSVSEMEKTIANGGLVRDNKGNWLKSGDRVRYIKYGSDGEWHTGTVDFDVNNLCWYLDTDDDGNLHLAHYYFEVERFEKLEG